jgi:hypothetical protein
VASEAVAFGWNRIELAGGVFGWPARLNDRGLEFGTFAVEFGNADVAVGLPTPCSPAKPVRAAPAFVCAEAVAVISRMIGSNKMRLIVSTP